MTCSSACLRPNKSECRRWHPFEASIQRLIPYVVPAFVSKPLTFPRMSNLTTVYCPALACLPRGIGQSAFGGRAGSGRSGAVGAVLPSGLVANVGHQLAEAFGVRWGMPSGSSCNSESGNGVYFHAWRVATHG